MPYKLDSNLIKIIQTRRRKAGLTDENHHDFMLANFGKTSCTLLTEAEADTYLDRLEVLGQSGNRPSKGAKSRVGGFQKGTVTQEQFALILWGKLAKAGKIKDSSEQALGKFVFRTVSVQQFAWCTKPQKSKVITGLQKWLKAKE